MGRDGRCMPAAVRQQRRATGYLHGLMRTDISPCVRASKCTLISILSPRNGLIPRPILELTTEWPVSQWHCAKSLDRRSAGLNKVSICVSADSIASIELPGKASYEGLHTGLWVIWHAKTVRTTIEPGAITHTSPWAWASTEFTPGIRSALGPMKPAKAAK